MVCYLRTMARKNIVSHDTDLVVAFLGNSSQTDLFP